MAFKGVRSSWLIIVRKFAFDRFARSATSRAFDSAARRWLRSNACAHITPSVSTNAQSSSSKICGAGQASASTPRISPFAHTGTMAAASASARIIALPQSPQLFRSSTDRMKMASPERATCARGSGASRGNSFSAAFTSSGTPTACIRCSVACAGGFDFAAAPRSGGNRPSVTTTALVAPKVPSAVSSTTFAANLKGDLLIVHGTGDDNVHYQQTEYLIDKLIAANKHFTIMPYPNRTHSISEGEGTTLHLYSLLTRYLNEKMPANATAPTELE